MTEMVQLLHENFVQDALKAALMVAVVCSYLGVFVVLKRIVFVGAALAEISSLGAALAFFGPVLWAFEHLERAAPFMAHLAHFRPLVMALLMMLLAVVFFSQQSLERLVPREAVIGTAFAGAAGLTILTLSKVASEAQHSLDVLNGNILGVQPQELIELMVACLLVALVQLLFYKEFVLIAFDPEVARTLGYRSGRWELLWYLSLGVMIAVSIHVAGTILVFAFLVIPPVSALLLSRRLGLVLVLSVCFGALATLGGVLVSVSPADVPTSPTIVGISVVILAACLLIRRVKSMLEVGPKSV